MDGNDQAAHDEIEILCPVGMCLKVGERARSLGYVFHKESI